MRVSKPGRQDQFIGDNCVVSILERDEEERVRGRLGKGEMIDMEI